MSGEHETPVPPGLSKSCMITFLSLVEVNQALFAWSFRLDYIHGNGFRKKLELTYSAESTKRKSNH